MGKRNIDRVTTIIGDPDADGWQEVRRANLPVPIRVRVSEVGRRSIVTGLRIEDPNGVSPAALRAISIGAIEAHIASARQLFAAGRRVKLSAPSGRSYDDAFYGRVAAAYLQAIDAGERPAPALAAMTGAPTTTVHRWVREARNRGLLPPARRGKAG